MTTFFRSIAPLALALGSTGALATAAFPDTLAAAEVNDTGTFRGADRSHPATGTAEIVPLRGGGFGIKLHSNFDVRGGPDLRVWVSEAGNPRSARAVRAAGYTDLGRLRSSDGEQIYRIPADVEIDEIGSVVIWCRAFGVFFASASLS
ncbi:DM13 domain-containing protein [Aurantiacibacter gangjinensis]|uniref:DM13 domain-containing protein n=1 Tax=Aurantiacibacter gangjinensis TaxID=502682 RepID=UPI000699BB77|nr:DM13 domain-containing protein [Aurantiacibacter gangjinensis]APE28507.1 putative secreted protein [Aurantiacibacter gangjinensis]